LGQLEMQYGNYDVEILHWCTSISSDSES